jgi:hypothetical protein
LLKIGSEDKEGEEVARRRVVTKWKLKNIASQDVLLRRVSSIVFT